MFECTICKDYGFRFKRNYEPVEFIEGKTDSLVWIVGLNPAAEQNWVDARTKEELGRYFDDPKTINGYFKDFEAVSEVVFSGFGTPQGTAHTDIVKCSSKSFPPETAKGEKAKLVISNCKKFLESQLKQFKPKIIVCNGTEVSKFMLKFLPPPATFTKSQTSYWSHIGEQEVCVVLSGFIGRIDNYAKRRLGIEIENRLHEIQPPQT